MQNEKVGASPINQGFDPARDLTLDFVKGVLVVFMVIYHVMNIFSTASPESYGYIRFVSGSFLFISGYVISIYYEQKFQKNRIGAAKRLVIRGLKLLLIFTILNVAINLSGVGNPIKTQLGLKYYISNFHLIYGLGSPGQASFQILLPISYLLVISPVILLLTKFSIFLAALSLMAAFFLSFFNIESVNFGLGIIGVIGLFAGMLVNKFAVSFIIKNKGIIYICLALCFYLMSYLDRNALTYSLGVALMIKLFYDLGMTLDISARINQIIVSLGQYSLVCYIAQIIFLQCLAILLFRQKWPLGYEILVIVCLTNIFLVALCFCLAFLRTHYTVINKTYRFIFA